MAAETIRLASGHLLTGRIVAHLGDGRVEIDVEGRRYTGRKAHLTPRRWSRWT